MRRLTFRECIEEAGDEFIMSLFSDRVSCVRNGRWDFNVFNKSIAVEYVKWLMEEKSKINRVALSDLEIFENGMKLDIPKKVIDEFDFTGLCNVDFILSDFRDRVEDEST